MFVLTIVLLFIQSIISIDIDIDENIEKIHDYNNQFLKSALSTCTFSIGLADMFAEGWGGNYVNVYVGVGYDQYTRISVDSNPVWYNFTVNTGDSVHIDYFSVNGGTNPALVYYSVTNAPDGSGDVVYSYMPTIATIPNTCLDECEYSITLYAGNSNMWQIGNTGTIYLNGIPISPTLIITDSTLSSQTYNFGTTVKSTDVITVQRPMLFYDNMGYAVFSLPNGGGEQLYELINDNSGPSYSQTITNYCGLNANLAVVTPSSVSFTKSTIPVAIDKYIPGSDFLVKIFLVCGSQVKAVIQATMNTFAFQIPQYFGGDCYFYSSSLDYSTNHFLNSENLPIVVLNMDSPFGGELIYIPPEQTSEVARSFLIAGSAFTESLL